MIQNAGIINVIVWWQDEGGANGKDVDDDDSD